MKAAREGGGRRGVCLAGLVPALSFGSFGKDF
jgi:hypothetical protein